jgi:hypothetical protein
MPSPGTILVANPVFHAVFLVSRRENGTQELAAEMNVLRMDVFLEGFPQCGFGGFANKIEPVGRDIGEDPIGRQGIDNVVGIFDK